MMTQREVALTFTEELRRRKTLLKEHMAELQNEITSIDIQIRDIRQHMPKEEVKEEKPVKHRETMEEKRQRMINEIIEIDKRLGANQK